MSKFTVGWAGVRLPSVDPYKSFRFRLKSDGHSVAGFGKCAGLQTSAAKPQPVRLERGVTRDQNFASWIGKPTETWGASKHKDLVVEIYNEAGQLALTYKVYRAWVSEYQALPDLDANANAVAIQHIKLENEGWERDREVPEPSEPTFTVPAG